MTSDKADGTYTKWILRIFRFLLGLTVLAIVGLKLRIPCGGSFGFDGWVLLAITSGYLLYSAIANAYTAGILSLCCVGAGAYFINVGYSPYYTNTTHLTMGVMLAAGGVLVFYTEVYSRWKAGKKP